MSKEVKKILVIDDDPIFSAMLQDFFSDLGYPTFCISDGRESLEMIRNESISVVISDIMMPRQEGIATIRAIKREFPRIKVLAVTGMDRASSYLKTAEEFGADKTFMKSVLPKELLAEIEKSTGVVGG